MRTRTFLAIGLLAALLIAGVASFYASSRPDGLSHVAEKTGFSDQETTSAAADGPFAGYSTRGVDNERLSGGLAGVVGCLLVLGISGAVFYGVRRKGADGSGPEADAREHESV